VLNDFTSYDQYASIELATVIKMVNERKQFEPMRVVHISPGKDAVDTRYNSLPWIKGAIESLCGHGKHYANQSEYHRHWDFTGLAFHSLFEETDGYDPVVSRMILLDHEERMRALDDSIEKCGELLGRADGVEERELLMAELLAHRAYCEAHGHIRRLVRIDRIIDDRRL